MLPDVKHVTPREIAKRTPWRSHLRGVWGGVCPPQGISGGVWGGSGPPGKLSQLKSILIWACDLTLSYIKNMIWNIVRRTSNLDFLSLKTLGIKPAWFIFKGQQVWTTACSQHKSISLSRPGHPLNRSPHHSDILCIYLYRQYTILDSFRYQEFFI